MGPPVLDRKERDKKLRESDILKAAERIFAAKGYHKTTIQDIAREAQYAVGTIYLYFKNKQTIYLTLIEQKISQLFTTVKAKVKQVDQAKEKIRLLVEEQLAYFEENQDFFRIYLFERVGLRQNTKDRIPRPPIDKFMKYIDYIAELIKQGQREGFIKKEVEAKKIAHILASMMNAVIFPWLRERSAGNGRLKGLSKFILDVFYEGLGVRR